MRPTITSLGVGALLAAIACSGGGGVNPEPASTTAEALSGPGATGAPSAASLISAAPPALKGDLRAPDPAIIRDRRHGGYYVFSTGDPTIAGGTVQIRHSSDLQTWTYAGNVFTAIPPWIVQAIPGVQNLWAPDIHEHDGVYYLYYAASTFGSNQSLIALATNTTLDPTDPAYAWVDQGLVTSSSPANDFNAIDPNLINDESANTPWLAFGSFFSGVRMLQLEWPSGKLAPGQGTPLRLADRFVPPNALEAPFIHAHGGWFYLFVSFDFCCQGTNSTYKIAVGRSRTPNGPYFDRLGTPMEHGGGTVILSENATMFGPGGQSIDGDIMAYHFYDGTVGGDIRLGIRPIFWIDGWPVVTAVGAGDWGLLGSRFE
jgi:arabinan endo-1,5-alpha-L-arabinosidase